MCTVTYLPLHIDAGKEATDFILTSNRDEKTSRPSAYPPSIHQLGEESVIYPLDPQGKGSWIAASSSGTVVCLLNGAFLPHAPKPSYTHSRGLVVTEYFNYEDINDFEAKYDFAGLEPFTLVIVENGGLAEIRWDEKKITRTDYDPTEPRIWSSVTLYSPQTIAKREKWFDEWVKKSKRIAKESNTEVIDFHKFGGEGDTKQDILMNRDDFLRTVSITSVLKSEGTIRFQYIDQMNGKEHELDLEWQQVHE